MSVRPCGICAIEPRKLMDVSGARVVENTLIRVNISAVIRLRPMGVNMFSAW